MHYYDHTFFVNSPISPKNPTTHLIFASVPVKLPHHDSVLAALSRAPAQLLDYPGENQLLFSGIKSTHACL